MKAVTKVTDRIEAAQPRRFRPYPEYRDSGVEWLGEIPTHWEVKRLKFGTHTVAGQSPPSMAVFDGISGLPFLQGNAEFGPLNPTPRQSCDTAPKRAESGDILLSVRAPVGAMNIADQAYGIGRGLCAIRPASGIDRSFCFYQVMAMRTLLDAVATGSTYDAVTVSDVGDLLILLPHQGEQRDIAAFLDRETAKIDALVARKERLIELLQEKRTALITRAVTRGFDPNVPMKDSGVKWLGEIPAHWEVKKLGYLTNIGNGSTPNRNEPRYWVDGSHPWLTSAKINEGIIATADQFVTDVALRECHLPPVPAGSILVAITGEGQTRGRAALLSMDSTISQHLAHVTPRGPGINAAFLVRLFGARYEWLRDESSGSGSTRGALTCEFLRSVRLAFPARVEQRVIATFLDRETARVDALIVKIRQAINHLNEFRTALISAAVTGKIDVREAVR